MNRPNSAAPAPAARQRRIEEKLSAALSPLHLEVEDESSGHNVPPGAASHFRVVAVAAVFAGESSVARHRRVYAALAQELAEGLHALALHTYTPQEWQAQGGAPLSPPCRGEAQQIVK